MNQPDLDSPFSLDFISLLDARAFQIVIFLTMFQVLRNVLLFYDHLNKETSEKRER